MTTYSEKLRDPRWQRIRLEVMQRDGFKCKCCGDEKTTLNVHHLKYHGEPWEAPPDELETLCDSCHAIREGFVRWAKRAPTKAIMKVIRNTFPKHVAASFRMASR